MENSALLNRAFVADVKSIIENGRNQAYASVNLSMINTYWNVGQRIVEEEQHGEKRAEYGAELLKNLAIELIPEYGSNYSERRLLDYRLFYLSFKGLKIWHSRVPNLTWTHFRHLLRVEEMRGRKNFMIVLNPCRPSFPDRTQS